MLKEIRRPKSEIRKKSKIRKPKRTRTLLNFSNAALRFSDFFRISDFDLRISSRFLSEPKPFTGAARRILPLPQVLP